jgi:hypothetical protein
MMMMKEAGEEEEEGHPHPHYLKVVSWNINGIRKFQIDEVIRTFNCSILGLQETKVPRK